MIDLEILNIPSDVSEKFNKEFEEALEHPLIKSVLSDLKDNLPDELYYHTVEHTEEVIAEVILFGLVDWLSPTERELLAIAAAYHDSGFLVRRVDNEILGAERAVKEMKLDGHYADVECKLVYQMILDTRLIETPNGKKQDANTNLSRYLLDADLANFGRIDFLKRSELQRKESGQTEDIFYKNTLELVRAHEFYTQAALKIRHPGKVRNIEKLQNRLMGIHQSDKELSYLGVSLERLGYLTQLPVLLNSSLETKAIVEKALSMLQEKLKVEAATIFMTIPETEEIEFWALHGGGAQLSGERLKKGTGIVGWVIENKKGIIVDDVSKDPRFFSNVDTAVKFTTKNLICVPLIVRGSQVLGALQVLNSRRKDGFTEEDLRFAEHVSLQLSLALENAQLLEKLKQRNQELEAINKRKSETVSLIAHEFRTPLNILYSGIEILGMQKKYDPKLKDLLQGGINRMVKLIDEVRNLAIVSGSQLKVEKEVINLQEMFNDLEGFFNDAIQVRNINMVVENCSGIKIEADKHLILIVLRNLISNAIRFTPDHGSIIVQARPVVGGIEISVIDSGIGIPEKELDLIFQKFYEIGNIYEHSSGTYEFKSAGLGLGLSTCKAILNAHGSSIKVESTEGKGSRFYFLI